MAVKSLDVRKFAEITDVCENAKISQFWSRFQNLQQFFCSFVRGSFVAFSSSVAGSRLDCAVRTNRVLFASNDCASLQVLSSVELRLLSQWGRRRGLSLKSSFCFFLQVSLVFESVLKWKSAHRFLYKLGINLIEEEYIALEEDRGEINTRQKNQNWASLRGVKG